jgi:hypothetical protein
MNIGLYRPTDWSIVTSAGGEIDVGLSRVFFAGLTAGAFYVRQGGGAIQRLPFVAIGGGFGLAASALGVITLTGSLPSQPGGGWRIYRNRIRRGSLTLSDLEGGCFCMERVLAAGVSGGLTLAFFGRPIVARLLEGSLSDTLAAAALDANAAGILWGTGYTPSAGGSGSVMAGQVRFASPAAEGETDALVVDQHDSWRR